MELKDLKVRNRGEAPIIVDYILPSMLEKEKPNLKTVASMTSYLVNDFPLTLLHYTNYPRLVSNLMDYSENLNPAERKEAVKRIMGMVAHNWDDTLPSVHQEIQKPLAEVMERLTKRTEYFKNPYVRSIIRRIHNSYNIDTKINDFLKKGQSIEKAGLTQKQGSTIHTFLNLEPDQLHEKIQWLENEFKKSPSPEYQDSRNRILAVMKYVASKGNVKKEDVKRMLDVKDENEITHENSRRILESLKTLSPYMKKYRQNPTPSTAYKMLRWLCNEGLLETGQFKQVASHIANGDYQQMRSILVSAWGDKMQPGREYLRDYGALKKDKQWLGKEQHKDDILRRDVDADSKSQKSHLDVVFGHVANMNRDMEATAVSYPKRLESAAKRLLASHPEIVASIGSLPGTQLEKFGEQPILIPAELAKEITPTDNNSRPLLYYNGRFCFINQTKKGTQTTPIRLRTLTDREQLNNKIISHKQNKQQQAVRRIFGKAAYA
ncbi:MAG: hypothetical protein WC408_06340 [Candidatus Micrarchaeia archaeon]|jgi:hypothetical protein